MHRKPSRGLLHGLGDQARLPALHFHCPRSATWAGATLGWADPPTPAQVCHIDSRNDLNLNKERDFYYCTEGVGLTPKKIFPRGEVLQRPANQAGFLM